MIQRMAASLHDTPTALVGRSPYLGASVRRGSAEVFGPTGRRGAAAFQQAQIDRAAGRGLLRIKKADGRITVEPLLAGQVGQPRVRRHRQDALNRGDRGRSDILNLLKSTP